MDKALIAVPPPSTQCCQFALHVAVSSPPGKAKLLREGESLGGMAYSVWHWVKGVALGARDLPGKLSKTLRPWPADLAKNLQSSSECSVFWVPESNMYTCL